MAATTTNTGAAGSSSSSSPPPPPPPLLPQVTMMHQCLAEAACEGNLGELTKLLCGDNPQGGSTAGAGGEEPSAAEQQLMRGVTAEGDTALHLVAAGGEGDDFKKCAKLIITRHGDLLTAQNSNGDTALHVAARAGKPAMVSLLVDRATAAGKKQELLMMMNRSKETALHEAVRVGDEGMVQRLLTADPDLARVPERPNDGNSPLYLAILLRVDTIAEKLKSYSGPDGLNALHAAVLRGPELTNKVLKWNKGTAAERDENGSTPLHFAAGLPVHFAAGLRGKLLKWISKDMDPDTVKVCSQVLEANRAALYQADNSGLFPIHVAASVGAVQAVGMFVGKSDRCAGLRNVQGRTFLHVAVEKNELKVVRYACSNPNLAWIMNMRDNDGNTALHLAVLAGNLGTFSTLLGTWQVRLDLTNVKGQTPRDIAEYKVPPRLSYELNSDSLIRHSLNMVNASSGVSRRDHFRADFENTHRKPANFTKELNMLKDSTQVLSVGSVLIVTVTFGATLALPGGYRADDHAGGGSPTLAGRYPFLAFLMANTIAFMCSSIATVGFMYSGSPMVHLENRIRYMDASIYFMQASITSLAAAFALGMYSVLAPVAPVTAATICVIGPLAVAYSTAEFLFKASFLVRAFWVRKGPFWTLVCTVLAVVVSCIAFSWPVMFIFGWAAYPKNYPSQK